MPLIDYMRLCENFVPTSYNWHGLCVRYGKQKRNQPEKIMRTTALAMNAPEMALAALEAAAEKFNTATENVTRATKTVVMFAGAPLLGLVFLLAVPVICVALTAYYGAKLIAWATIAKHVKNVALFFAAPFVALAYVIALPVVGLGTLAYLGMKAARK